MTICLQYMDSEPIGDIPNGYQRKTLFKYLLIETTTI